MKMCNKLSNTTYHKALKLKNSLQNMGNIMK